MMPRQRAVGLFGVLVGTFVFGWLMYGTALKGLGYTAGLFVFVVLVNLLQGRRPRSSACRQLEAWIALGVLP